MPKKVKDQFEKKKIEEVIRKQQQGLGKPIISADFKGYKFIAVGNRLHYSPSWKTFPDFLFDFILAKIGKSWFESEIAKPLELRHPIMQWHNRVCYHQKLQTGSATTERYRDELLRESGLENMAVTLREFKEDFGTQTDVRKRDMLEKLIKRIVVQPDNKLDLGLHQ